MIYLWAFASFILAIGALGVAAMGFAAGNEKGKLIAGIALVLALQPICSGVLYLRAAAALRATGAAAQLGSDVPRTVDALGKLSTAVGVETIVAVITVAASVALGFLLR